MRTADWHILSEEARLVLSREALHAAADAIAVQAERLADEIESGALTDQGGAEALRLLAAVVRAGRGETRVPVGHA